MPETKNKIVECYDFFKTKILEDIDLDKIRDVVNIILEKLPVIHMALSVDDDVQQIFDTINSLGVKLTTGELLKNYLFSFPTLTPYYERFWKNIFETDEESIVFWDTNKTSGRIIRTTIELFLYSFLVIIKEENVKLESLFKEFKLHLKDKTPDQLMDFAIELSEYAKTYEQLPDGADLKDISYFEHEKRFFHLINELEINTVFPLVLYVYKRVQDDIERGKIILCLESYLVRRTVCKLTTKNYNKLFISIMVELKNQATLTSQIFLNKLLAYEDDTNKFPSDDEFRKGFANSILTNKYTKEVLYCIALYQLSHEYQDNNRLSNESLSIEHLMPKKWNKHWSVSSNFTKQDEEYRDSKLLTLGNLTLIKGRLNSSLRDSSWNIKQKGLEPFSTLTMTRKYLNINNWDENSIAHRTNDLFKDALIIWKSGMPNDNFPDFNQAITRNDKDIKHETEPKSKISSDSPTSKRDRRTPEPKPKNLEIFGKNYEVKKWNEVLVEVINYAIEKHPEKFELIINAIPLIVENPSLATYKKPTLTKLNNGYYVETSLASIVIKKHCGTIFKKIGLTTYDWKITTR